MFAVGGLDGDGGHMGVEGEGIRRQAPQLAGGGEGARVGAGAGQVDEAQGDVALQRRGLAI